MFTIYRFGFLRQMADNSFEHAKQIGCHRVNKVHGEEEAKLVLEEYFQDQDEAGESRKFEGQGTLEDPWVVNMDSLIYPSPGNCQYLIQL